MLRGLVLYFLFLTSFCSIAQTPFDPETESDFVKASYTKGNLITILSQGLTYPETAVANGVEGNVIYSLKIDASGILESVEVKEEVSDELAAQAEESIEKLTADWVPSKVHGNAVDREYLVIFSYNIYYNSLPTDYHGKAKKFQDKGKLEKAVKVYDEAIENNPYTPDYYIMRARLKKELGDLEGASNDQLHAEKLKMELLAMVEIGQTQTLR